MVLCCVKNIVIFTYRIDSKYSYFVEEAYHMDKKSKYYELMR
jgi:hypothetical protein